MVTVLFSWWKVALFYLFRLLVTASGCLKQEGDRSLSSEFYGKKGFELGVRSYSAHSCI